jgi:hypothetical protein
MMSERSKGSVKYSQGGSAVLGKMERAQSDSQTHMGNDLKKGEKV